MAATSTPEGRVEFGRSILSFLQQGAGQSASTLRGQSSKQLEIVCRRHFDGLPPQYVYGRVDWRVVQEMFSFIWAQAKEDGRREWAGFGEELYAQMEYLQESPGEPDDEDLQGIQQALSAD